jgi:HSP20 family protein
MNSSRFDNDMLAALLRNPGDLNRMLNPRSRGPREHVSAQVWSPPVDVYEDHDAIVIKADLPGIKQEEIDIEMTDDTLTIRGERTFEDEARREQYVRVERQYGKFQRSFTIGLPVQADKVTASYRNGILEVTLPKAEAIKPKKVQVSVE